MTTTLNPVRDEVVKRALRMVGAYNPGGLPRPQQLQDAIGVMNMMLKEWQMKGLLWLKVFGTLFLNKGQTVYNLADTSYSGFSHCATAYVQTNLSVNADTGADSVTVDSATGITTGDFVGVANDSGTIEWFYASVSGTTISLFTNAGLTTAGALTADAALGNVVYAHTVTSQITRPTRCFSAVRKLYDATAANGYEIPLEPPGGISRTDYERLPNKTITGKVIQYYYDPQLTAGKLYVWPTADDPGDKLIISMDRSISVVLSDTDTFDVPAEALNAISYKLAVELEPEYPMDPNTFAKLKAQAEEKFATLVAFNRETAPVQFTMDERG